MCFCSSSLAEYISKKQNASLYNEQPWKRQIMSPLEPSSGLFIAQCTKDNDTFWSKGQSLLPSVHI